MAKRILTLTLIGLMAAVFIFPVCANALEDGEEAPQSLTATQEDVYDTTPTFTWAAVSGPTTFDVTIGANEPVSIPAGTFTDGKWDDRVADTLEAAQAGTDGKNCLKADDVTTCYYTYTPLTDLPVGNIGTWTVAAIRAAATTDENDPGFDGTNSTATGDAIAIFGDITLSLTADKTGAEVGDTVTVAVSMDNITNGDTPVNSVTFSVSYNGDVLALADPAFEITDRTTDITPVVTPSGSGTDAKAEVVLAGAEITAGTGDIVKLMFTAAGAGDNTFAVVNTIESDIVITSETVIPPTGKSENPSVAEGEAALTVAEAVTQGDLNGDETVDLADALIALKVVTGQDTTAEQATIQAHVAAYGQVGLGIVLYIMAQ